MCSCEFVCVCVHFGTLSVVNVCMKLISHMFQASVLMFDDVFSEGDSPLTGLQRPEGLQSLVHAGKVPETNVVIVSTRHQTGSRRVQGERRHLTTQLTKHWDLKKIKINSDVVEYS